MPQGKSIFGAIEQKVTQYVPSHISEAHCGISIHTRETPQQVRGDKNMKLYSYWQSSASYRVRIALNLKGLKAEIIPGQPLQSEQKSEAYRAINPQQIVPSLIDHAHGLTQSLAIIEYLEEKFPEIPLLPQSPPERARVRAIALAMACEIAPLGNLRVRQFVHKQLRYAGK